MIERLVELLKALVQAWRTRGRWRQFERDMAQFEPVPSSEDSPDEL